LTHVVIAADWWNPVTWLQSVGGFFHGAYSAGSAVLNVLGSSLTILTQFFRFFFDTGHFIADAVNWITNTIFPPELQTWFLGTIGSPGQQSNSTQIYESLYQGMVAPALMIASVAAAGRIIRALADHRTAAMETILSVLPRFLLAVAIIGVPGTSVSLGYSAIVWAVNASVAIAGAIVGLILNTSFLSDLRPGDGWFSHVYSVLALASHDMVAVVAGGIPLLILVLYAAFLMIVRTVMLGFCVVMAPLCLATAVFDSNNRFFHWWLDVMGSVLLTPLLLGVAISLSLTLASHVVSAAVVGPVLAMTVLCGGLWFAGKLVHQLAWRGFSHGSALAGFAAGVATMVAPVHRLSSAGFIAEALGANREGGNSAVNFMKRMGLAVQGLSPAHAGSAAPTSALSLSSRGGSSGNVVASGGPPNMAGALGADGQAAIEGAEGLFSQDAFNAYAASHGSEIGTVTRDRPYGSVSAGDRAKLAWSRTSTSNQAAFADDFLSSWLSSGPEPRSPHHGALGVGLPPIEVGIA
jgi:type IV secretory pathway VirB6-like protein